MIKAERAKGIEEGKKMASRDEQLALFKKLDGSFSIQIPTSDGFVSINSYAEAVDFYKKQDHP